MTEELKKSRQVLVEMMKENLQRIADGSATDRELSDLYRAVRSAIELVAQHAPQSVTEFAAELAGIVITVEKCESQARMQYLGVLGDVLSDTNNLILPVQLVLLETHLGVLKKDDAWYGMVVAYQDLVGKTIEANSSLEEFHYPIDTLVETLIEQGELDDALELTDTLLEVTRRIQGSVDYTRHALNRALFICCKLQKVAPLKYAEELEPLRKQR